MWQVSNVDDGPRLKYQAFPDTPFTFREAIDRWRSDVDFREDFAIALRDAPFAAYRWETPPVTKATLDREFEFVLIDCPQLKRAPDRSAFDEQFRTAAEGEEVIAFENLGRDATLVVPCPPASSNGNLDHFVHLASFVREADNEQVDAFWQLVGETMNVNVGDKPIWLSTAGMGVAWLHVRLDQRPKYYAHGPYRNERPE